MHNEGDPKYGDLPAVRTVDPPLPLLRIPAGAPDAAKEAAGAAAKIVWLDPSSAAGRLRTAVERVLDDQGVSVTTASGARKSAHARIEEFQKKNQLAGDAMMAVKWIGNSGAHDNELTISDVLDGAIVLELALKVIYDTTDAETIKHIQAINAAKGVPKK